MVRPRTSRSPTQLLWVVDQMRPADGLTQSWGRVVSARKGSHDSAYSRTGGT